MRRHKHLFGRDHLLRHFMALQESVTREHMVGFYGSRQLEGAIRNLPPSPSAAAEMRRRREEEIIALMVSGVIDGPLSLSLF